jgi:hypothetical protein
MAEKNPDMFGASIVFEIGESLFVKEELEGKKVDKEYFRLKDLRATDIVDEPAATDGLFSENTFPGIATQFLDENPEIMDLIFSKPDSVVEFLSNYLTHSKMNLSDKIKQNFAAFLSAFSTDPSEHSALSTEQNHDKTLNTLFDAFCASYPESFSEVSEFTQQQKAESITAFLDDLATKNIQLSESFASLNAEHEALLQSSSKTTQDLDAANSKITELSEKLKARPSIPLNVTDPQVTVGNPKPEDTTGKQILKNAPKDLRFQLKKQPNS